MLTVVRVVALGAVLVCAGWLVQKPGWDSAAATFAALVVFLASFLRKKGPPGIDQSQKVSRGSTGIQAGRDVRIGKEEK
ncbi:MAG: hypothetical protein HY914_02215 [Desulfomonile tiedjei]|nr:hypothetical protein [Desulfomonile tiedjei]